MAVGRGTKLFSIAPGKVVQAAFSDGSGNFIIIEHEHGYESRYAHCDKLYKKKGDNVKAGELVALSGCTGKRLTGAHAHFGMRKDGKWLDPLVIYPEKKAQCGCKA